jgi:5'-phosphate synthase pdxT subunit
VLALQGDVREHLAALGAVGARSTRVRRATELDDVDAIVIPGGESTTIGKLLVTFDLLEPLQKRVRDGMPAYGSCAGMILLADRVLDGTVDQVEVGGIDMTVRRNAFGRQVDSFEGAVVLPVVGEEPMHAVFIRAPWVEDCGDGVEVLATVDPGDGAPRIVAVRQGALLATSFHPELTGDTRVHALFAEMVRENVR